MRHALKLLGLVAALALSSGCATQANLVNGKGGDGKVVLWSSPLSGGGGGGGGTTYTGTANQVIVTGSVLSTPQDLGTASTVRFGSLGLGGAAGAASTLKFYGSTSGSQVWTLPATGGAGTLTWPATASTTAGYQLTNDGSGGLSWAAAGSGGGSVTWPLVVPTGVTPTASGAILETPSDQDFYMNPPDITGNGVAVYLGGGQGTTRGGSTGFFAGNCTGANGNGGRMDFSGGNGGSSTGTGGACVLTGGHAGFAGQAGGDVWAAVHGTTVAGAATAYWRLDYRGNVLAGLCAGVTPAATSTSATDGFFYLPTCAGTPTGVPTAFTGGTPCVVDSTNHKLCVYEGGSWHSITLP